jgi:hypothetical protein
MPLKTPRGQNSRSISALPGHQRAQQRLTVNRIRFGAPVASRHGNRRRIDDLALNAVGLEQAVNPETIEPDFVDRHNPDRRCNALLGSFSSLLALDVSRNLREARRGARIKMRSGPMSPRSTSSSAVGQKGLSARVAVGVVLGC